MARVKRGVTTHARHQKVIKADSVRCIGADGEQLGVISINEALKIAEN